MILLDTVPNNDMIVPLHKESYDVDIPSGAFIYSGLVVDTAMQTRLVETMIEHCDWLFQDTQNDTPTATPLPAAPVSKPVASIPRSGSMEGIKKSQPQAIETAQLIRIDSGPIAVQSPPPPSIVAQPLPPAKPSRGGSEEVILPPPARTAQRPPPAIPRAAPPTPPKPYAEEKVNPESPKPPQSEFRGPPPPKPGEDGVPRPTPAVRPRPSVRLPKKPGVESTPAAVVSETNVPTEIMFVIDTDGETRDNEVAQPSVTEGGFVSVVVPHV